MAALLLWCQHLAKCFEIQHVIFFDPPLCHQCFLVVCRDRFADGTYWIQERKMEGKGEGNATQRSATQRNATERNGTERNETKRNESIMRHRICVVQCRQHTLPVESVASREDTY